MSLYEKCDILAFLKLYEKEGRYTPTPQNWYGCLIKFNNDNFFHDCRVILHKIGSLKPGESAVAPVLFLNSKVVKRISVGDTFKIWEGKYIGEGRVEKIL